MMGTRRACLPLVGLSIKQSGPVVAPQDEDLYNLGRAGGRERRQSAEDAAEHEVRQPNRHRSR
jgi:hypothetical protein